MERRAAADGCESKCKSALQHCEAFSHRIIRHSEHASSLTLRQRCQRYAFIEVEVLEGCAAADAYQAVIESIQSQNRCSCRVSTAPGRSLKRSGIGPIDGPTPSCKTTIRLMPMQNSTFRERLERAAVAEVELLESCALCDFYTSDKSVLEGVILTPMQD